MRARFWFWAGLTGLTGTALAVDPRLHTIVPPGVQAGTQTEWRLEGDRLEDAQEILFYKPGFQVKKLEEIQGKFIRATIETAPHCVLGEHQLRVRTATGISDLRSFYVGPFPLVTKEPRPPDGPPQKLPLNSTVSGSVANETVDRYRVEARKGQRLSAEVESMRLGRDFFDPYVSILDKNEKILARSDDTALFIQDGFASTVVPEDGEYTVEVRETSYGALGLYRLHVGAFPRPTAVYPPGGQAGAELEVRFIDPTAGDFAQRIKLPAPSLHDFGAFPQHDGVTAPSWNLLRVSEMPNALESEPNDAVGQAILLTNSLPLALNGILEKKGDVDWFRFQARKGESFDVQVQARSLRSPLDSVLTVANAKGQEIAGNDDAGAPDSYVRFNVPEDGEYTLLIRDHLGNGGPDYTYRVELDRVRPSLSLYVPDSSQYDTQTRKSVVVARGNRFLLLLNARRKNFGGDLVLSSADFPAGVSLQADTWVASQETAALVFEAAPDAPVSGKLAQLTARLANPADNQPVSGGLWQNYDLVQRGNQGVYYRTWVDRIAVAVVEELPFKIRIEEPKAPLVRDGTLPLKIVVERKAGFAEPVKIQFPVRPPGLNCEPEITIPKEKDHAFYALSASGNAEIKDHKIALLGFATVQGGTAYVGSQLTPLKITEPFVEGKIPLATTIQGNPVQVKCELTHKSPFDGKAKVELVGLPPGAQAAPKEITKEDKEVVFDVTTAQDARTGLHRTLFCQLTLAYNSETLTQSFGGRGTLRIDAPPTPPEPEKKAASTDKPPGPPSPLFQSAEVRRKRPVGGWPTSHAKTLLKKAG